MTASELPIGAQFSLAGSEVVYTVTHQVPGRGPCAHLTYVRHFCPWDDCEHIKFPNL